jgi:protein gp37
MVKFGKDPNVVQRSKTTFNNPLKWKEPKIIFTCSWSDFFHPDADEWRQEAWEIIKRTPQHTYQILTKRPERMTECLPSDWNGGYDNVWLGVSVENQDTAGERIPYLAETPAKLRFLSMEPLLDEVDLFELSHDMFKIHWIIIGGESGNEIGRYQYRPMELGWIMEIIGSLALHNIRTKVFVKQLGTYQAKKLGLKDRHGGNIEEWPWYLQIREMPQITQTVRI